MRADKLTNKLQQAVAEAQTLALESDNQYLEPQHLLAAMAADDGGGAAAVLQKAGAEPQKLHDLAAAEIARFPKVGEHDGAISRFARHGANFESGDEIGERKRRRLFIHRNAADCHR